MATWKCVKHCGACCNLDPADRPDLENYLSPTDLEVYLSLVGEGGWCIHYDKTTRECSVYNERPWFCRVEPTSFQALYGVAPDQLNDFAIDCCEQQIEGVYGAESPEMEHFWAEVDPVG